MCGAHVQMYSVYTYKLYRTTYSDHFSKIGFILADSTKVAIEKYFLLLFLKKRFVNINYVERGLCIGCWLFLPNMYVCVLLPQRAAVMLRQKLAKMQINFFKSRQVHFTPNFWVGTMHL